MKNQFTEKHIIVNAGDLIKVERTCCPQQPAGGPFTIGQLVHLNSGSCDLTVVDFDTNLVTVAWKNDNETIETTYPHPCLHYIERGS